MTNESLQRFLLLLQCLKLLFDVALEVFQDRILPLHCQPRFFTFLIIHILNIININILSSATFPLLLFLLLSLQHKTFTFDRLVLFTNHFWQSHKYLLYICPSFCWRKYVGNSFLRCYFFYLLFCHRIFEVSFVPHQQKESVLGFRPAEIVPLSDSIVKWGWTI